MRSDEEWRAVVGYEGLYEVSDQGRVRSLDRWAHTRGHKNPHLHRGRILSTKNSDWYFTVALYRPGLKPRTAMVHSLVAETYLGPRPDGLVVRHINDVKQDNRVVNLRYGTDSDNKKDAVRNGLHSKAAQTHCKRGHEFTPENTRVRVNPTHRECRTCRVLYRKGQLTA